MRTLYQRRYYLAHREEKTAKMRARYETDEAYRESKRKHSREWKASNPHRKLSHLSHLAHSTAHLYFKRLLNRTEEA